MSLQTRAEVEIEVVAKGDQAVQTNRRTVAEIKRDYKALRDEQQAVRHEFELNNRSLVSAQRLLRGVGSVASTLTTMWTKYNVAQIRVAEADRNAQDASAEYMRTLAEFGPTAQITQEALKRQNEALDQQKQAADQARLMYIFLGIESAQAIAGMIGAIPKLKELAQTLKGVGAASTLTGAASVGGTILPGSPGTAGKTGGLKNKIKSNLGPALGATIVGGLAYDYFTAPGDQTGLVDVNNPNAPGSLVNDAFATFLNTISEGVGAGKIAATTGDLKEQVSNSSLKSVLNQNTYNFYGYDSQEMQREIAQGEETSQVYGDGG